MTSECYIKSDGTIDYFKKTDWILANYYFPYVKRIKKKRTDFQVYHKLNKFGERTYPKLIGEIFNYDHVWDFVLGSIQYCGVGLDPLIWANNRTSKHNFNPAPKPNFNPI